jgi:phosphatidylglycerophosphate synthase
MDAQAMEFRMVRQHTSVTAAAEKRLLIRIAKRLPMWINSDHLTFTGFAAMAGIGACFWAGGAALWLVIPLLAVNWFGDSLDGTVARVRHHERPRYGYYVDHVLDAIGFAMLFGGLVLGSHMSPVVGVGFLAAYYLLVAEISMATHARGTFRMSFGAVGPTELRIVLAAGVIQLMRSDAVTLFGREWLLFDVGGAVGIAGLLLTFVVAAWSNGVALYSEERLATPNSTTPNSTTPNSTTSN